MRRKPRGSFAQIVKYLNSHEVGFTFNIFQIKSYLNFIVPSTLFFYLKKFWLLGFLEKVETNPISYTIVRKIPDKLNTVIMMRLYSEIISRPSWKDWFVILEDRIDKLYEQHYGEE